MIDLHSHILAGVDDGAVDLDESLAIARSMVADGTHTVAATPHVRDDYPTTVAVMELALRLIRDAIASENIGLDVRPGGEIALDWLERLQPHDLKAFGLGGNERLILLEYPYYSEPAYLASECVRLQAMSVVPVIAHPERNRTVQKRPDVLRPAIDAGAVVQLTAASVDGRLGRAAAGCAQTLLELGLAHLISSDAHSPGLRQAGLSSASAAVGGGKLGRWLTEQAPAALLAGEVLPPRPASGQRPWWSRLRT